MNCLNGIPRVLCVDLTVIMVKTNLEGDTKNLEKNPSVMEPWVQLLGNIALVCVGVGVQWNHGMQ